MKTTANTPVEINVSEIDRLGFLNEQIKALTEEADAIKNALKAEASLSGARSFLGSMFVAVYTESNRATFDYKKLVSDLNLDEDQVAAYTKTSAVYTVKVVQL